MREIKFRAWFKYELEMREVATNNVYKGNTSYMYLSPMPFSDYQLIELMQFTGLYDKNSKEIYERDIVSYFGNKYKVLFRNGAFGWMEDGAFYSFNEMARSEFNKFEIIGNVYENLELLEESK